MPGIKNVEVGNVIEEKVRKYFNLKKDKFPTYLHPDVLDFDKRIVGDIKGIYMHMSISAQQIERYIELKDELNSWLSKNLNGDKREMTLRYYFAFHDNGNNEFNYIGLKDIYIVGENGIRYLLENKPIRKMMWSIKLPLRRKISMIKDKQQKTLHRCNREIIKEKIINGNPRGAIIDVTKRDLEYLCPSITPELCKDNVTVHI